MISILSVNRPLVLYNLPRNLPAGNLGAQCGVISCPEQVTSSWVSYILKLEFIVFTKANIAKANLCLSKERYLFSSLYLVSNHIYINAHENKQVSTSLQGESVESSIFSTHQIVRVQIRHVLVPIIYLWTVRACLRWVSASMLRYHK